MDLTEDDKNNKVWIYYLKKKWKKGRENECECIVHKDEFKSITMNSSMYKYARKEN